MAWMWTDDLATTVLEAGLDLDTTAARTLREWARRPVAFAVVDDIAPLEFATRLLGVDLLRAEVA